MTNPINLETSVTNSLLNSVNVNSIITNNISPISFLVILIENS